MSLHTNIAVIIPYFGPWPPWIEYFLLSCQQNPEITWILPSDHPPPQRESSNVKFVPFTLQDFNRKASDLLNLEISVRHPYKICDLKPAYADIFAELIEEFDFWGYGDLDLVYGKITNFLSDKLLNNYDVISNHPDFITGHYCLLRNVPKLNVLYRNGEAYKKAFTSRKYVGFDEQIKSFKINPDPKMLDLERRFDRAGHMFYYKGKRALKNILARKDSQSKAEPDPENLKDFTSIVRFAEANNGLRIHSSMTFESDLMMEKKGGRNWKAEWNNGELTNRNNKELLYFHFMLSKKRKSFKIYPRGRNVSKFSITSSGINPIN